MGRIVHGDLVSDSPVDFDSPVPVWRQVADDLRAQIASGKLPAGSRMPSEPDLTFKYGVARNTLRKALAALEEDKLIIRTQGRGTFVAR